MSGYSLEQVDHSDQQSNRQYGTGCCFASILIGKALDYNYRRSCTNAGSAIDRYSGMESPDTPFEKARLPVVLPQLYLTIALKICHDWALQPKAPLAITLLLQFIISFYTTSTANACSNLLMDLYPTKATTVSAANNLFKCLFGAVVQGWLLLYSLY